MRASTSKLLTVGVLLIGSGAAWAEPPPKAPPAAAIAASASQEAAATKAGERPGIQTITAAMDDLFRSTSSEGEMEMYIKTPDYERTMTMDMFSLGKKYSLIRITAPRKEVGTTTLKRENEMWNYVPKIRKTIRVPPSLMMGSWMGSDFTNDDLVKDASWEDDYSTEYAETHPDGQTCLISAPRPKAPVTWSKVVGCFETASLLPIKQDFYDEKGKLVRTMAFSDVKEMGGKRIPAVMTLTPHGKPGNLTRVTYKRMKFDAGLKPSAFSLSAIRRSR
ncbi:MAG: outer membrane lipoprotein-sorting protein [Myxococcota bacterium]|jgi:outer membrane lipoprotein-sorting protein